MLNRAITVAALAVGGVILSKQLRRARHHGMASSIEESIDVNVPVSTAYNQWTQFEDFPKFMDSVLEIRQLDDTHLHWRARIGGKEVEWDAEITEQIPDKRIAWRSIGGARNAGAVTFQKLSDSSTRITLQMEYDPRGFAENAADMLGAVRMQLKESLKRYKELVESRGQETGAWRGTVAQGTVAQH
ncbi:MAG: SRPBCC family protein [Pseudomonadota bacterium]